MDVRRFYVISPRGELGPFSVEELNEELSAGRITPRQQVRTGMGTMLGTVREVLIAPEALWNTAESGSGLTAVAMAQRRTRMVSLVVLGLTLVPALSLMLLLGWGQEADVRTSATAPPAPRTAPAPGITPPPVVVPVPPPPAPGTRQITPVTSNPQPATRAEADGDAEIVRQEADGVLRLMASSAIITSKGARLQGKGSDNPHIGSWNDREGGVEWRTLITKPGRFTVVMTYACNRSGAGAIFRLAAGDEVIDGIVQDTGSWDTYKPQTLARQMTIATAGPVTISLSPQEKKSSAFMKLSSIVLTPVP